MKPQSTLKKTLQTDMPLWSLALLALLAMPRAVVHDTRSLPFDSPLYLFLAIAPLVVYLAVAVVRRHRRPLYDFVVMGLFFGIFLALAHLVLWEQAWGGNAPRLGDQLEGVLSESAQNMAFRIHVAFSSLIVGLGIGAIFGTIAVVARKVRARLDW